VASIDSHPLEKKVTSTTRFELPVSRIPITKSHIENALAKRRESLIIERQLFEWATVVAERRQLGGLEGAAGERSR
jgi:hypothetical protein